MLGTEMKLRRKALDMNQAQLGSCVNLQQNTISQFERCRVGGRTYIPDAAQIAALVDALYPREDEATRARIRAQWTYYAALDLIEHRYPGALESFKSAGIKLPLKLF